MPFWVCLLCLISSKGCVQQCWFRWADIGPGFGWPRRRDRHRRGRASRGGAWQLVGTPPDHFKTASADGEGQAPHGCTPPRGNVPTLSSMLIQSKAADVTEDSKPRCRLHNAAALLILLFATAALGYSYSQLRAAQDRSVQTNRLNVRPADANPPRPMGNRPQAPLNAELARQWSQVILASGVQLVSIQFTPAQHGSGQIALSLRGAYKDVRQALAEMLSRHPEMQLRQLQMRPAADASAAVEAELQLVWLRLPRSLSTVLP
jgi:hypothetical protein